MRNKEPSLVGRVWYPNDLGKAMYGNGKCSTKLLQDEIRKQLGSHSVTRFVHSLPLFRIERDMPTRLSGLLAELDRAEGEQREREGDMNGG
jgi:hypothetical protein